jgi:hypothetical protein
MLEFKRVFLYPLPMIPEFPTDPIETKIEIQSSEKVSTIDERRGKRLILGFQSKSRIAIEMMVVVRGIARDLAAHRRQSDRNFLNLQRNRENRPKRSSREGKPYIISLNQNLFQYHWKCEEVEGFKSETV